jgi:predicted TIM-barrel fold metal-dependent hydrolase
VIDHMGGFDDAAGVEHPGFVCLRDLVADGHAWVKLCAYRNLLAAADFELGRLFHEALLRANPQRLVWGSDWPHLRVSPVPDAGQLLGTLRRWTPADDLLAQILVANPETLYR